MNIQVKMRLEKQTKNTYRYAEVDENTAVRTLYVQKSAMPVVPQEIVVTISVPEEG